MGHENTYCISNTGTKDSGEERTEENALCGGRPADDLVRGCIAQGAAADVATFKTLWKMGSLGYLRDVRVLSNRASRDVTIARALIDSLREAVVDMSSEEENEVVRKIDQVADTILDLSQVCDVTLSSSSEKRSECMLRFMESLLDIVVTSSSTTGSCDVVKRFVAFLLNPIHHNVRGVRARLYHSLISLNITKYLTRASRSNTGTGSRLLETLDKGGTEFL